MSEEGSPFDRIEDELRAEIQEGIQALNLFGGDANQHADDQVDATQQAGNQGNPNQGTVTQQSGNQGNPNQGTANQQAGNQGNPNQGNANQQPNIATTNAIAQAIVQGLQHVFKPPTQTPFNAMPPKMGKIVTVDGKQVIQMGGVPLYGWAGLKFTSAVSHPYQYRSLDKTKGQKGLEHRLPGLEPKWKTTESITRLQTHLLKLLVNNGMEQCAYLPHPNPIKHDMINVVKHPFMTGTDLNHVKTATNTLYHTHFDSWDKENDRAFQQLILDCLDPALLKTVSGLDDLEERALVTWIKVVRQYTILTREQAQKLTREVKSCLLSSFPGRSVPLAVDYLRVRVNTLYETKEYDPIILVDFLMSFYDEGTSPYQDRFWREVESDLIIPLEKAYEILKRQHSMGVSEIEDRFMLDTENGSTYKGLDRKSILDSLVDKYMQALNRGHWHYANSPTDKSAPHPAFGAASVHALTQDLSHIKPKAKGHNPDIICHKCHQKGHIAKKCPHKVKSNPSTNTNTSPSSSQQPSSTAAKHKNWKYNAPAPGEPSKRVVDGQTWEWCGKCNRGKGRWTSSHNTSTHSNRKTDTTTTASTNLAIFDTVGPAAWLAVAQPNPLMTVFAELFKEHLGPMIPGFLLCLAMVHFQLLSDFALSVLTWTLTALNWTQLHWPMLQYLGMPLLYASLCLVAKLVPPLLVEPAPNVADRPPLTRAQKRRLNQQVTRWFRHQTKSKPASIFDYNVHKRYPRHLRSNNTYYRRAPTIAEQEVLGALHTHVAKRHIHRSLYKRSAKARSASCHRKGETYHKHRRPPCRTPWHCPSKSPFQGNSWTHSASQCWSNDGLACRYPMDCPYASKDGPHNSTILPTQAELDACATSASSTLGGAVNVASIHSHLGLTPCSEMASNFIKAALLAPHKLKQEDPESTFQLIWDSGASHCITNDEKDFVGPIERPGLLKKLTGLAKGLHIKGVGSVEWTVLANDGSHRTLRVPAYYVPESPVKLIGTASLLQQHKGETIQLTEQSATLSGIDGDPSRSAVTAFVNPTNNIPSCTAFRLSAVQKVAAHLQSITTTVDPNNINLSEPEKELLRWHQRLGHLDYRKIQFLMTTGVLCLSPSKRALHASAAKLRHPPLCAACQFGKQTANSVKTRPPRRTTVDDRAPVLKDGKLLPGQTISVDHFVCSTKGVTLTSKGGATAANYSGGCIFVDNASGLVHVEHQQHLNTHETLKGKEKFELMCRDYGVVPIEYISDSGSAFTSKEFDSHLSKYQQIISFAGTGAHHHNAIAERSIRTIMSIARTMMLHAAIHWPNMADATLWPLAVDYAVHIFNRVPNPHTGLSPLDVFSNTRQPQRRLHDLHVWGSPAYLLDKTIADGKKLPRWKPKSERVLFVGVSPKHTSTIPRVLNPRTRAITTPYHVVFDDWFATVGSDPNDLPDFESPEWQKLFGNSVYQYVEDESWVTPPHQQLPDPVLDQILARREQVAQQFDHHHQRPLSAAEMDPPSEAMPPFNGQPVSSSQARLAPHPRSLSAQRESLDKEGLHLRPMQRNLESKLRPMQRNLESSDKEGPPLPSSPLAMEPTHIPSPAPKPVVIDLEHNLPTAEPKPRRRDPVLEDKRGAGEILHQRRIRRRPKYMIEGNTMMTNPFEPNVFKASKSDPDTLTLEQALADKENYSKWLDALDKEITSLEEKGVWEEVLESEAKGDIVPTHWVMKIKRKPDGSLDKFKARIVVRGDLMHGYEFQTHSPVCAWSTIRMVLILALTWEWHTCTCDYSNAFTHATLPPESPVWIKLPRGYKSKRSGKTCLKLIHSLYGTNFAPKLWSDCLFDALKRYGLKQSEHDPCLFSKPGMMACVYVDDLALACKDSKETISFLKAMESYGFTLTMDDTLEAFLGIKFKRNLDGSFNMTQPALIQKVIEATGMTECNRSPTPAAPNTTLGKDPNGEPMAESWSYPSIVGMLLYLSTNTRCDITFAVSQVARFTHDPKQSHATAIKRIVRYLAGTKDKGMIMKPDGTLAINSHSDADFAGLYKVDPMEDTSSAKSRMGFLIKLGGCPLVWRSQLIDAVCLATAEAEYYSLSHCLRTLLPIRRVLEELAANLNMPTSVRATITSTAYEDNSAALTLANNQRLTSRTRYYHTAAHHFWQHVNDGTVSILPIETSLMDADILTKAKPKATFEENRKRIQGW